MGRRKIEIKAIKDDRNRSVTFLKRKGGLFKKAHELSVLCSVDVAVFIFGSNKKLYEYSSTDMRELIHRYTYHGGPNEHKGPADFNGGDDGDDEDEDGATPPRDNSMDPHMMPPHPQFPGQFPPHMRHHTPSASPPIASAPFQAHPHIQRGHTPQPHGSRPASRTGMRRISAPMLPVPHQGSLAPGAHPSTTNGFAYMPQPAIYQPQNALPLPGPAMPPHYPQYPAQPNPPPHLGPMPPHGFADERRGSASPLMRAGPSRLTPSPPSPPRPIPANNLPPQPISHVSPPPPPPPSMPRQLSAQPPSHELPPHIQQQIPRQLPPLPPLAPTASMVPESEPNEMAAPRAPVHRDIAASEASERPRLPVLRTSLPKKLPQRKGGSIFTPIDDNKSILQQHFSSFAGETRVKADPDSSPGKALRRSQTPPLPPRTWQLPETIKEEPSITPPSRSSSIYMPPGPASATARPQLKVQIPTTTSEAGTPAGGGSGSPHNSAVQSATKKGGILLPPPSPSATASASALLSAGATGPPNPFARPQPRNNGSTGNTGSNDSMNVGTPASSLPSRFLNSEFLPSPSNFYPDFTFRGAESNTLPSPLNYATPLAASGPSFLRDDPTGLLAFGKRKSPEISGLGHGDGPEMIDAKRIKVE